MSDLVPLGIYELAFNYPPLPIESLLDRLSSEHARRTYRKVIDAFLAWIERGPLEADPIVIDNYKGELLEYCAPSIVAVRLQIIRELYQEVVDQGRLQKNPAAGISLPGYAADPFNVPPPAEQARGCLEDCNRRVLAGRHDYALRLLAAETEIQPEEMPGLRVRDYRKEGGRGLLVLYRGESREETRVELSAEASQALDAYLEGREVVDDSPLFALPWARDAESVAGPSDDQGLGE